MSAARPFLLTCKLDIYYSNASTRIRVDRIVQVCWNRTRRHSRCSHYQLYSFTTTPEFGELTLIRPSPIILPPDPIGFPAPKEPTILLLIRTDLCREPLAIPCDVVTRRGEIGIVPFEFIGDAEAEFADDGGPVAAAVVVAGEFEVGGGRLAGAGVVDAIVVGPFEVTVIVVGGEEVVSEILVGVARAPFRILHGIISRLIARI